MPDPPRVCAYPGCKTPLSRYNDGLCCSLHETYNRMARAGLRYTKVPEQDPARHARGRRQRG